MCNLIQQKILISDLWVILVIITRLKVIDIGLLTMLFCNWLLTDF